MGSQGMKRKGRTHLPKVGTPADEEHVLRQSRSDVVNFGRHRPMNRAVRAAVLGLVVLVVVVLIAFFALT